MKKEKLEKIAKEIEEYNERALRKFNEQMGHIKKEK